MSDSQTILTTFSDTTRSKPAYNPKFQEQNITIVQTIIGITKGRREEGGKEGRR